MRRKFFLSLLCMFAFFTYAEESPTERYVSLHTLIDIKYNLRLDNVTLDYKPIFDKAIAQEVPGFVGYYGASGTFRVYQDLIRLVFEEILDFPLKPDFHFLAVPLYLHRTTKTLEDISQTFFGIPAQTQTQSIINQLLPIHISLYGNHHQIGFCPAKNFSLATEPASIADLYWLFETLELDTALIERALAIGQEHFGTENRVLLQLFTSSTYQLIDENSYPASPTGYPYANQAVSDYLLQPALGFPPQAYLLLHENGLLNPASSLVIKRYTKIQPTKLQNYEKELRALIKTASFSPLQKNLYRDQLMRAWN